MRPRNSPASAAGRAAGLLAGHGMAAQELAARDVLARGVHDFALGAAGVGHQRAGAEQRVEMADGIEDAADGVREKHQVRFSQGLGQRGAAIDGAAAPGPPRWRARS